MAIKTSGRKDGIFNEINITPLTDIFLVLLIIMMVIAPMFQSVDQDIKLPSINTGLSVDEKEITVAVTKNANFFVNSKNVKETELAGELEVLLKDKIEGAENTEDKESKVEKKIIVKADAETKTTEIMKVIRAAQAAGYEKLTVAGEPLSAKQQEELEEKENE